MEKNMKKNMKQNMKQITRLFLGIAFFCLLFCGVVYAEEKIAIMGTHTGENSVTVYVKGLDPNVDGADVQIGTSKAKRVDGCNITELDVPMRTKVLIENSVSVSQSDREKIGTVLLNLISDRVNNEEIAIYTVGEQVNQIAEYTSDYESLRRGIDSLEYEDEERDIAGALYEFFLRESEKNSVDTYHRMVLITDGIDDKLSEKGMEDIHSLMKTVQVPIYTIGCQNKNSDALEKVFALSRLTGAESFLLSEYDDLFGITDELKGDRSIVKMTITPIDEMMDGSMKTIKITSAKRSISTEVVMPFKEEGGEERSEEIDTTSENEPEDKEEETVGEQVEESSTIEATQKDRIEINTYLIWIVGAVVVLGVGVCIYLLMKNKKRLRIPEYEAIDRSLIDQLSFDSGMKETEFLDNKYQRENTDNKTVMIWNSMSSNQVVLTDVHSPGKIFQSVLNNTVTIGRNDGCDIVLNYDKSISGHHCEIRSTDGKYYVKDLQSTNGTSINGTRVLSEMEIVPGSVLKMGRVEMRFEVR